MDEKDWREKIYTGPDMPDAEAQRQARGDHKGEWRLILFPALVILAAASLALAVWSLWGVLS